ncbi:TlpA disulfide reductase family protein [Pedobacter sp.]|uniref:TlpA family protein disulfide reductase n=1 Tax=Pedobacter sp. TaxID=1411316 RepID=UPI0031E37B5E
MLTPLSLVLFSWFAWSAEPKTPLPDNFIILSGKITHVSPQTNGKTTIELTGPFGSNTPSKIIPLQNDGSFTDTIKGVSGVYMLLDDKNQISLYLEKSKRYSIFYDADQFKKRPVTLGGADTAINRYYIEKSQHRLFFDPTGSGKTEAEWRQFIGELKANALEKIKKSALPPKLASFETKNTEYKYLFDLFLYLAYKEMDDPKFKPSAISVKELDIDYSNEIAFKSYSPYWRLVTEHHFMRFQREEKKLGKGKKIAFFSSTIQNETIRNVMIGEVAISELKAAEDIDIFYTDFSKSYTGTDEKLLERLKDTYLRLGKLKKGTLSPKFTDYRNFNGGTNSLEDYKGKYVYIDLWASWCGNCWNEMPYLKQLEEKYLGKNIVFLSISTDEKTKDWENTITEQKLTGIQLLQTPNNKSFTREYAVYGIPRYIFLDPDGKIIDYNAPRPSDMKELAALFRSVGL